MIIKKLLKPSTNKFVKLVNIMVPTYIDYPQTLQEEYGHLVTDLSLSTLLNIYYPRAFQNVTKLQINLVIT